MYDKLKWHAKRNLNNPKEGRKGEQRNRNRRDKQKKKS